MLHGQRESISNDVLVLFVLFKVKDCKILLMSRYRYQVSFHSCIRLIYNSHSKLVESIYGDSGKRVFKYDK